MNTNNVYPQLDLITRMTTGLLDYGIDQRPGYHSAVSSRYAGWMKNRSEAAFSRETAGLCMDCTNMRRVESSRGSVFVLCELSRHDPRFLKYPRLPVLACEGYRPQTSPGSVR